jgi:molybdopterin converting factor small subunit|tara:strand:+ start:243 stop:515 length:273 start_codon:yes stop_codon:yes gene_type:complete
VSVKVNIAPFLTHLTADHELVEVNGGTVGQCLDGLVEEYPGIREWLFAKNGKLNNVIEIYVNAESSYPDELTKPVNDGDELQIVIMIVGG